MLKAHASASGLGLVIQGNKCVVLIRHNKLLINLISFINQHMKRDAIAGIRMAMSVLRYVY